MPPAVSLPALFSFFKGSGRAVPVWRLAALLGLGLGLTGCSASEGGAGAPAASTARGQRLLAHYQCGSCHAIPEVPATRRLNGPSLQAFGKRSYIAGHLPNRSDTLAQWIMSPQSLVPDSPMPDMGVSPADARDMAAYLGTLQ